MQLKVLTFILLSVIFAKILLEKIIYEDVQPAVVQSKVSALVFLSEEGRPPSEVWHLKETFLPHLAAPRDSQEQI